MTLKPALTEEEWQELQENMPTRHYEIGSMMSRHGIAAWALHDQPFGFTREDVKILNAVLHSGLRWEIDPSNGCNKIVSLVSRLEALLPPEEDA